MRYVWLLALCVLMSACESKVSVQLSVVDTDNVDSLSLDVAGVSLLEEDGSEYSFDSSADQPLELSNLFDGETTTLVGSTEINSSTYDGLALRLSGSSDDTATDDDGEAVSVSSSTILNFADMDLDIGDGDSVDLTAVLELRFSLSRDDIGNYSLDPWIRVVQADLAVSISGRLNEEDVTSSSCRQDRESGTGVAVYVFDENTDDPVDFNRDRSGPIASAPVRNSGSTWYYDVAYLQPGTYVVAWTCSGDSDSPTSDDDVTFSSAQTITLDKGEAGIVDF